MARLKRHPLHERWIRERQRPQIAIPPYDIPQWAGEGDQRRQLLHARDYRVEELRGQQVHFLDERWSTGGRRNVVEAEMREVERSLSRQRYGEAVKAVDKTIREFDVVASRIIGDWRATISDDTIVAMKLIPGYADAENDNDLLAYWDIIDRVMMGEGVASMQANFAQLDKWGLEDGKWRQGITDFQRLVDRILGAGMDPQEVLDTLLTTKLVLGCKSSERLKTLLSTVMTEDRWPNFRVLLPRFANVLRVSEEFDPKTEGILANAGRVVKGADKERESATGGMHHGNIHAYASRTKMRDSSRTICNNCAKPGHILINCPEPMVTCDTCGELHHTERHEHIRELSARKEKRDRSKAADANMQPRMKKSGFTPKPGSPAAIRAKKTDMPRRRAYLTTVEEDEELDEYEEMLRFQEEYLKDREHEEMAYRARVQQEFEIGESDEDEDGVDILGSIAVLEADMAADRDAALGDHDWADLRTGSTVDRAAALRDDDSVDLEAEIISASEMSEGPADVEDIVRSDGRPSESFVPATTRGMPDYAALTGGADLSGATMLGGNGERLGANPWYQGTESDAGWQARAAPARTDRGVINRRYAEEDVETGAMNEHRGGEVCMGCGASQDDPKCDLCKEANEQVDIEVRPRREMRVHGLGGVFMWLGRMLFAFGVMLNSMGCARADKYDDIDVKRQTRMMAYPSIISEDMIDVAAMVGVHGFREAAARVMDSACTHNLWRSGKGLLNLRPVYNVNVTGVGGTIKVSYVGDHPNASIGKVYVCPEMEMDLASIPQMLKNGCKMSAVGKLMVVKDKRGKIVFHAIRDASGLYVAREEDVLALAGRFGDDSDCEEDSRLEGVPDGAKGVLDDHEDRETADRRAFSKIDLRMSDADFAKFLHGHYTREQRKRAAEAMEMHAALGHPSHRAMRDMLENGVIAGCHLTGADIDNAYKLFGGCNACAEGKLKLPPEPESKSAPAPRVGHTLYADMFFYDKATLGGNNMVVIAEDEKSGAALHAATKRKTAQGVGEALDRIVAGMNRYGHRVENIVFDDEAVFVAMRDVMAVKGINCMYTPAGLHNKRVERMVQTLKSRMRTMKADLDYRLPSNLTGELLSAAVTAMNSTPNSRTGPTTTPFQLITGKRPHMKKFKFGQVGMCECRRADSPDLRAEWGIYMGTSSNVDGHIRVFIPERGLLYSRRTFRLAPRSPSITEPTSAPAEWNYAPRRRLKKRWEPTVMMPEPKMGDDDPAQEGADRWREPNAPVQRTTELRPLRGTEIGTSIGLEEAGPKEVEANISSTGQKNGADATQTAAQVSGVREEGVESGHGDGDRQRKQRVVGPMRHHDSRDVLSSPPGVLRRSGRLKAACMASLAGESDCTESDHRFVAALRASVRQALSDPDPKRRESALKAIKAEISMLLDMRAMQPVKRENISAYEWNNRVYPSHMFLKDKYLSNGDFERVKARLVAGGNWMDPTGLETRSPTVNPITVMTMINIAATEGMEISCHDIKGAFLVPEIDRREEAMYIRIDPAVASVMCEMKPVMKRFVDDKGRIYMRLQKYLYGLPQASFQFNKFLDGKLRFMGFVPLPGDPCAYTRGKGDKRTNVCIHVDDLMVCAKKQAMEAFVRQFKSQAFEFTTQDGPKLSYIGMTIKKVDNGYVVSQEGYRKELMSRFEMDIKQYKGYGNVPAGSNLMEPSPEKDKEVDKVKYLGMVMSVMYIARLTRADVLFPTVYLASRSQKPTEKDYLALCRVLKYLERSGDYGIHFKADAGIAATIYTDASHGVHPDGKGHVGMIVTLGSGYVSAKSTKIKITTLSSTESEGVVLCEATTYARWIRDMLKHLGHEMKTPTRLFMDNESAILLADKDGSFARNKHVMIRRNYTREGIQEHIVKPVHKATGKMVADMCTKIKPTSKLLVDMAASGMVKI